MMMQPNGTPLTAEQLGSVVDALQHVLVQRADLVEFADAVEQRLPDLIARAAPPTSAKCAPTAWRFRVVRDENGDLTDILATPEALPA